MKLSEVATLLAYIALTDNRTVGEADVHAWADVLPEAVTFADAKAAVIEFRRASDRWLTPANIIERVVAIRKTRMAAAGQPPFPPDLTVGQEIAWRRHWIDGLGHGRDSAGAARYADGAMGISRPALSAPDPGRLTAIIGAGVNPDPFSRGMAAGDAA